jgi:hypothetical protein
MWHQNVDPSREGVKKGIVATRTRTRVKCFAYSDRCLNGLNRSVTALHEGFWLGCLSADDLNAVTGDHFDKSKCYASSEHNLGGLFSWEAYLLDHYFRPASRLLVAAAGGGREVLALRRAGFDAEGFECCLPLVWASEAIFGRLGEPNHVIHCAPDCVPAGLQIYEGLILGWTAYTHIPTKRSRALPHSPILLSFFTRACSSPDDILVYRIAKFFQTLFRSKPVELGDRISFARYVHSFTHNELEEELRAAGFRLAYYKDEGQWGCAVGTAE